ncbi:4-hydroxythreonine-4-phosphate dehydrogenase [Lentisphaera araneosa HTCC2155]|uniref:4-hydroxythreonine-4-phosphate dehydrogenase n=1 Tax=Lentisphaera araneosa HTCC2155 TaxID=313628 RepID=A6DS02_9BACT|nr:4-hydroxythreonine-4-phosphate dehydrogenase PdxA [Lentisphaera araneosa]EDM25577.1 4-hydroxythreonine-4-phosphate dehydrogenase [Lentisphaera araneosa HTCC2155]
MMKNKAMILTSGDPAGVGPEVAVKAFAKLANEKFPFVIAGDAYVLSEAIELYAPEFKLKPYIPGEWEEGVVYYDDFGLAFESSYEKCKASAQCGQLSYDLIVEATHAVIAKQYSAIVTAPVNKESVNLAGITFSGHTELIAELCECPEFNMMQSADRLRCVFATCHIALKEVPKALTVDKILQAGRLLHQACLAEGLVKPKLSAAGLNPHAGENGYMGREEIETVIPALEILRSEGIDIEGPFPPDTLFVPAIRERFEGFLCMYHDQGHIPFKMLAFDRGVNSTLGLPIIRTSVDHGTAFDIAWQNKADIGSLENALKLAWKRTGN